MREIPDQSGHHGTGVVASRSNSLHLDSAAPEPSPLRLNKRARQAAGQQSELGAGPQIAVAVAWLAIASFSTL